MNHLVPPSLPPRSDCLDLMAALRNRQPATHRIGERVELWVPREAPFVRGREGREGRREERMACFVGPGGALRKNQPVTHRIGEG
jgi:hypothetical protein